MTRLKTFWANVHSSLWFIPTLAILCAVALALGLVELDFTASWKLDERLPRLFGVSAEGSRNLLTAIATSMIAIAGVSFSITIVSLSLAASQYTPRVLRNFMRDRANQLTLGLLVGIFVYCLVVLRTIRGGDDPFIPAVSVMTGIVLSIAGIGMFIFFLHHIASAIQASTILNGIFRETAAVLCELFPMAPDASHADPDPSEECETGQAGKGWRPVPADSTGFIQNFDREGLIAFAERNNCVVRMEHAVGEFVAKGYPIVAVSGELELGAPLNRKINQMFGIQPYRSVEQDPSFGIRQIVDIAVKALSPGVNDPTTAVICVNYLGAILGVLVERQIPSTHCRTQGQLRLVSRGPTFESMVEEMFGEIRQNSSACVPVLDAMLRVIERFLIQIQDPSSRRREILLKHQRMICEHAARHITCREDLQRFAV